MHCPHTMPASTIISLADLRLTPSGGVSVGTSLKGALSVSGGIREREPNAIKLPGQEPCPAWASRRVGGVPDGKLCLCHAAASGKQMGAKPGMKRTIHWLSSLVAVVGLAAV